VIAGMVALLRGGSGIHVVRILERGNLRERGHVILFVSLYAAP